MKFRPLTLVFVLALVLSTLAFVSCSNDPIPPSESDSVSDSASQSEPSDQPDDPLKDVEIHNIIENGVPKYNLIRVDSASKQLISYINLLFNALNGKSDDFVNYDTDYSVEYLQTKAHDPASYEIVIGNTNYDQSAQVLETIEPGEYAIEVVGRKIVIVAHSDTGLRVAINKFITLVEGAYDAETKTLSLKKSDIEEKVVYDHALQLLGSYGDTNIDLEWDCGDNTKMYRFLNTKPEDMDEYVNKLMDNGYKLHTSHSTNNVKAATVYNDIHAISLFYAKNDNSTRIFMDDLYTVDLPTYENDYNSSTKKCDSKLIQIGTTPADNDAQNGECYLIQLEDGRFIIYDGGFSGNQSGATPRNNAKRIYDTMVKYSPAGKTPTVAAWFITHAHGDHVGALNTFLSQYSNKAIIEDLVLNYPLKNLDDADWSARVNIVNSFKKNYPEGDFIKIHPGQLLKYANVDIEVLYTIELYHPGEFTYFNTSSTVTRLSVGGQSIMMSGDMSTDANAICRNYYGDELKSDFYQVAHHGYSGGTNAFNKLCAPRWVLWPVGEDDYSGLKNNERNSWLSDKNSTVEIIFPALFQTTVINLPFDGTEAGYTVYPNS